MKIQFHKTNFLIFIGIFAVEIIIALFIKDRFIRPFLGDALVVFLLFFFLASFLKVPVFKLLTVVLLFAFGVEFTQYFGLAEWIGCRHESICQIILGATFDWLDLLAYLMGGGMSYATTKHIIPKLCRSDTQFL